MSLFKYRDLWRTQAGSDERFHDGCMVVDNIDNHSDGKGTSALEPTRDHLNM